MEFDMEPTQLHVDERIAFGCMAKSQKRYGSTSTRFKSDEIQGYPYNVQTGDTLQGLAIKFGVSTEQIRRVNQLWTNDSLFLRDKLIIPVQLENENNITVNNCGGESSYSSMISPISSTSIESQTLSSNSTTTTCTKTAQKNTLTGMILANTNGIDTSSLKQVGILNRDSHISDSATTTGKHWTHPLSDSFEYDEGLVSPDSINLSDSSSISLNSSVNTHNSKLCNSENSYQNGNYAPNNSKILERDTISNDTIEPISNGSSSIEPSQKSAKCYLIRDHSEKSANEFLSRIDSSIATTRDKTLPFQQKNSQRAIFGSDSECDYGGLQRSISSGGARISGNTTNSRQIRYSLRKLEKKQEELFQL